MSPEGGAAGCRCRRLSQRGLHIFPAACHHLGRPGLGAWGTSRLLFPLLGICPRPAGGSEVGSCFSALPKGSSVLVWQSGSGERHFAESHEEELRGSRHRVGRAGSGRLPGTRPIVRPRCTDESEVVGRTVPVESEDRRSTLTLPCRVLRS